jgi:hypothetical protein
MTKASLHALIPLFLIVTTLVACEDHGDRVNETETVMPKELADALEEEVGFRPVFPTYVPPTLVQDPMAQVLGPSSLPEVVLSYDFIPQERSPDAAGLVVLLITEKEADVSASNCRSKGSLDSGIDRGSVEAKEVRISERTISHDLRFCSNGLYFIVDLGWDFPAGAPAALDEAMLKEGERVVGSIRKTTPSPSQSTDTSGSEFASGSAKISPRTAPYQPHRSRIQPPND